MLKNFIKSILITVLTLGIFLPGSISVDKVYAAEATIDATTSTNPREHKLNPALVFISDQVGYSFYRNLSSSCGYSKTTDGGASWGSFQETTAQTDCTLVTVWYDQWTPGDTSGTIIHIAFIDTGSDDVWYDTLDTNGDSQGTEVAIDTTATAMNGTNNLAITKATDGVLYIGFTNGTAGVPKVRECSTTCSTGGNWSTSGTSPLDNASDPLALVPLASGNVMAIEHDISAEEILYEIYNTSTNAWSGSWTSIDSDVVYGTSFYETIYTAVDKKTNDIYLSYTPCAENVCGDGLADIRTAVYNGSWTSGANVITDDADGLFLASIAFNENNADVYVAYMRAPAYTDKNIYYKVSTNGMSSWGSETQISTVTDDLRRMRLNVMSNERIYANYYQNATDDGLFGNTVADLTPPTYKMSAYRFFANANSADVGSALASQDTAATAPTQGTPFRLRLLLDVSGDGARASLDTFKLQYAEKSGTCDTSYSGESYADVATGSGAIRFYDNATPTDGATLTGNASDPTHGGHTIVNQTYEEGNNFTNSVAKIGGSQDGKWDFSLVDYSATGGTSYCFRVVESDGSAIATPDVVPEITTEEIAQSLTFSISDNSVGFGTLSSSAARYATSDGLGASSESDANGTIPAITFAGGVTEVKATRTLVVNATDLLGSTTIGTCVIGYALTGSGDELDCSDNAATVDLDSFPNTSQVAASLRSLTGVTDSAHGALTLSGSGTSAIFTTTGTETSATAISFSDSTGDVSSSSSTSGVIGVAATVTIVITNSLAANATDHSVQVDSLGAIDLGTSALSASDVAGAIRSGITGAGGYGAKNYTVSGSGANIIFTRESTGSSGNGSLTINDDTYTETNAPGDAHTISASTNGTGGYVVSVNGSTLTCSGCVGGATITAIGSSATASSAGSEQFGLRVIVNSGTGSALSPYNTSDWALDTAAFPDSIASGDSDDVTSVFGIRYIGNITGTTEAGSYTANLTYTATATF